MDKPTDSLEGQILESKKEKDFPSAKFLFAVIEKEYSYELDRGKTLETRTGMFLAFSGAILVFIANNIKTSNLFATQAKSIIQTLPYAFLLIFLFLTLAALLGAIICFIKVISAKTYKRLSLNQFEKDKLSENAAFSEQHVSLVLITIFKDLIENHTAVNDKKVTWYKRGINFVLAALIFTSLTYISLLIIS